MPYKVFLKKGEEKRVLAGHSWVYANEVSRIEGKDKNGSLADVYTCNGRYIGSGYINHLSKILVRIFIRSKDSDFYENGILNEQKLFLARIKKAYELRSALGYDNCFRLVFAEADDLPALIIDKYDDIFVMQCLSLGIDKRKAMIADCLVTLFSPMGIYERSDVAVRAKEGLEETCGVLYGEVPDSVLICENGIKMYVDVKRGQKTGYFLDQKENRFATRRYSSGKVLDCFCNSGGFSLNAALSADSVTAVDISPPALANVKENASLNGFDNIRTVCGDVFEVLRKFKSENRQFHTVILDPPAFCKSAAEVKDAYRGYKDINILGMKLVQSGGFLLTASCSHYMTLPLFEKMLTEAAKECGRTARLLEIKSQAPDHPSLLCADETSYLKFFIIQII